MPVHHAKLVVLHAKQDQNVTIPKMDMFLFLLEFLNQDVLMENTSSTEPAKFAQALVLLVNHQLNVRPVLLQTTSTNKNVQAHAPTDTSLIVLEFAQLAQSDVPTVSAPTTAQLVATLTSNITLHVSSNVSLDTSLQTVNVSNVTTNAQPAQTLPLLALPVPLDSFYKEPLANLLVTLPTMSSRALVSLVKLLALHVLVVESTNVLDAMMATS